MKVLLRETIEKLGERGSIVDVADGYARNYLLPRGVAMKATEVNFKQLEMERAQIAKRAEQELKALHALRDRISSISCTIAAPASPEGHLYGSVGEREIADALQRDGLDIQPKAVCIDAHFKEVGVYVVELDLGSDLTAQTRVWIVAD